jgi:hypothetical protein
MPSFKDRINNYNAQKTTTVPVNPPEAEKVLEEKAAPEVAGVPEPVAPTATAASTQTAGVSTTPVQEPTRGQKAAATRAANKAAASATAPSAEPEKEAPTTHEQPASIAPAARSAELQAADYFVQRLNDLGYTVTLTKAPR